MIVWVDIIRDVCMLLMATKHVFCCCCIPIPAQWNESDKKSTNQTKSNAINVNDCVRVREKKGNIALMHMYKKSNDIYTHIYFDELV